MQVHQKVVLSYSCAHNGELAVDHMGSEPMRIGSDFQWEECIIVYVRLGH